MRKYLKEKGISTAEYTNVLVSLTPELCQKLAVLAQKAKITESALLRRMLDKYLKSIEKGSVLYKPYQKTEFLGNMRVCARTISREEDKKLRELHNHSGRSISEIIREAVREY